MEDIYTVIYLGDKEPPTKIVVLERTSGRFGGGLITGIGGRFEPEKDLDIHSSAERELGEEVKEFKCLPIKEFARCIFLHTGRVIHYFWGITDGVKPLPQADKREGKIFWVPVSQLLNLNTFPTTLPMFKEWKNRQFGVGKPWSMYITGEVNDSGVTQKVRVVKVSDELQG